MKAMHFGRNTSPGRFGSAERCSFRLKFLISDGYMQTTRPDHTESGECCLVFLFWMTRRCKIFSATPATIRNVWSLPHYLEGPANHPKIRREREFHFRPFGLGQPQYRSRTGLGYQMTTVFGVSTPDLLVIATSRAYFASFASPDTETKEILHMFSSTSFGLCRFDSRTKKGF